MTQEYFITYYETIFPKNCKKTYSHEDAERYQGVKKCFSALAEECEGYCRSCEYESCRNRPRDCITDPCPESIRKAVSRCSIGELTADEKKAFEDLADIKDVFDFVMNSYPELGIQSIADKVRHERLLEVYESNVDARTDSVVISFGCTFGLKMYQYQQTAKEVRECNTSRQSQPPSENTPSSKAVSPKPSDGGKKKTKAERWYRLRLKGMRWTQIVDHEHPGLSKEEKKNKADTVRKTVSRYAEGLNQVPPQKAKVSPFPEVHEDCPF